MAFAVPLGPDADLYDQSFFLPGLLICLVLVGIVFVGQWVHRKKKSDDGVSRSEDEEGPQRRSGA